MKLYEFPLSPNCLKVAALAHEVGLPFESVFVDIFDDGGKTADFIAKNPNGKVPVLEDGDFVLWESNAILTYIAGKADRADLAPATPTERADVDRWLSWLNAHLGPAMRKVAFERIVKKLANLGPPDEAAVEVGKREFAVTAAVLERSLQGRDYLCGRLTIADFSILPHVSHAEPCGLDLSPYPNLRAWLARMVSRPSVQKALSESRKRR